MGPLQVILSIETLGAVINPYQDGEVITKKTKNKKPQEDQVITR